LCDFIKKRREKY